AVVALDRVHLIRDASPKAMGYQGLGQLANPVLSGRAGWLNGGQRRSAGAAFEAGDGDVVGARLGHAGGNRAGADLGNQLHRSEAARVDVLEVEDELRQVLDRIDVMMGRR